MKWVVCIYLHNYIQIPKQVRIPSTILSFISVENMLQKGPWVEEKGIPLHYENTRWHSRNKCMKNINTTLSDTVDTLTSLDY